jgi:hypothetical protein
MTKLTKKEYLEFLEEQKKEYDAFSGGGIFGIPEILTHVSIPITTRTLDLEVKENMEKKVVSYEQEFSNKIKEHKKLAKAMGIDLIYNGAATKMLGSRNLNMQVVAFVTVIESTISLEPCSDLILVTEYLYENNETKYNVYAEKEYPAESLEDALDKAYKLYGQLK